MNALNLLFSRGGMIGGADGPTSIMVKSTGLSIVLIFAIVSLLGITERVLFAVAAYNDACAKSNRDAVMWGLLIGFLGLIPGIIYICVRNSGHEFVNCPACGFVHSTRDSNCPKCAAPNPICDQNANPLAAQQQHRAKILFTVALVFLGVAVLASVAMFVCFVVSMTFFAGNYNF